MLMSHLFDSHGVAALELNPANPINVRAGQDNFGKIDEPEGAGQRQNSSMESLWQQQLERIFPK